MAQKALVTVIDEFEKAVAALAQDAPAEVRKRLNVATGDLLEALSTIAQEQVARAAGGVYTTAAAITDDVQQLSDERKEDVASMKHNLGLFLDQAEIEQAELGSIKRALADLLKRVAALEDQQLRTREVGNS